MLVWEQSLICTAESMKNAEHILTAAVCSTEVSAFLADKKGCIDLSVLKRAWMG